MYSITECDFPDAFEMAEALETVHTRGRDYFEADGGQ
jgi:hypothetical protein